MTITECINASQYLLMEGALGVRLRKEYGLAFDPHIDMGGFVYDDEARDALRDLWTEYAAIAAQYGLPFIATTPTRRTNLERVRQAGRQDAIIRDNMRFLREVLSSCGIDTYAGGMIGCYGDAYTGAGCLGEDSSQVFHSWEIGLFREAGADFIYAALNPSASEAAGIALAARDKDIPCIISFTVDEHGYLPDGNSLSGAISYVDGASHSSPVGHMVNCVHPDTVRKAIQMPDCDINVIRSRFIGIQANASNLSHSELDGAAVLHTSAPDEFADAVLKLRRLVPLAVFGGCCGTDGRHMRSVAQAITSDPSC